MIVKKKKGFILKRALQEFKFGDITLQKKILGITLSLTRQHLVDKDCGKFLKC